MKPIENPQPSDPIEVLGLLPRTVAVLTRNGYRTLNDLCNASEEDVLRFNGIGRQTLDQIKAVVAKAGFTMRRRNNPAA